MVGAGIVKKYFCYRPQSTMFRFGNFLTYESITNIDPDKRILTSSSGAKWTYD